MRRVFCLVLAVSGLLAFSHRALLAGDEESLSIEDLVKATKQSIVVITFTGRDGRREGLGTGFIVADDGLVATNLHVLGEARPISVQLANGQRHDVVSIHAS